MKLATRLPAERSLPPADADQIALIREQIIKVGNDYRARHPWIVRNQNAIGLTIFLVSIAGVAADAVLYATGVMPWWICIPLTAFWLSLLHELEHDLIHWMYFRRRRWVHHVMMFGVWALRPNAVNPWIRRRWHLHHHEVSGTESDLEERSISNGEGWGAHRFLTILDHVLGVATKPFRFRQLVKDFVEHEAADPAERRRLMAVTITAYLPLGLLHYGAWYLFLGLHAYELFGGTVPASPWYDALNVMAVAWLIPNALRSFCLLFVSSNMHYFGDIEEHNVLKQTQVWTAKWLWPFQAFCFNFGGTHAIHHFVVRDPFYIRQAIAPDALAVLRAHGVRFNDFGTFKRANRYTLGAAAEQ
ncbi:MAG: fatty acid desaturase [Gemmatimonadetes bacterium]|nr:fatty acid desaturase [Gemmatimonadota bacterium]